MPIRPALLALLFAAAPLQAQLTPSTHPFGTLREQAQLQQVWLRLRLERVLPALMHEQGADCWVVPMREYNEDPVFRALVSPTTFAARRRTIYLFCDRPGAGIERFALGGSDQGGLYNVLRDSEPVVGSPGQTGELVGDAQWQLLRSMLEARDPRVIAVNSSRVFAFADGLTVAEDAAMREALGPMLASRLRPMDALAVGMLATRLPEEEGVYRRLQETVWELTRRMFSREVITPGMTRTSDLIWWWREQLSARGLSTWFQPSISVQRDLTTAEELGDDPIILPGDLLWCDVGIVGLGLHTDTQHNAYVLRPGESEAPAGFVEALKRSNRAQDLLLEEIRPGRTGNEVLASVLARMTAEHLAGTVYTHPIGLHGHGAGPLIGLWDRQEGVPGRGDAKVQPSTWWSAELQVTSPIPEWGNHRVRMAQEEDFMIGPDGIPRWAYRRQSELLLVR